MKQWRIWVLIAIFMLTIALRLFFAFQSPNFTDDRAYFAMRQVEHIKATGVPLFNDPLSFGGREYVFLPLFYYVLAGASFFMPLHLVLKIIPNILASTLVFIVYAISLRMTRKWTVALATALASVVIPIYTAVTTNSVSQYSLALPLAFLALYYFIAIHKEPRYAMHYLVVFFLLVATHTSNAILIIGMVSYLLLAKVARMPVNRREVELTLFSVLFIIWTYFLVYKDVFLFYGTGFFWQNIPTAIVSQYFRQLTLGEVITQVGPIPVLAGIFVLYRYLFKVKSSNTYKLTGIAMASVLLLWFRLVSLTEGLMMLSVVLLLFTAQFLGLLIDYLFKTKVAHLRNQIFAGVLVLLLLTSGASMVFFTNLEMKKSFDDDTISALEWIKENTNRSETVLGTLKEGHLITAIANRPDVMDSNFILIPNINQRFSDINTFYTTKSEIEAVKILNKYNVDYVLFSVDAKFEYKRTSLPFTQDKNCFQLVYDNNVQVYSSKCRLETV